MNNTAGIGTAQKTPEFLKLLEELKQVEGNIYDKIYSIRSKLSTIKESSLLKATTIEEKEDPQQTIVGQLFDHLRHMQNINDALGQIQVDLSDLVG